MNVQQHISYVSNTATSDYQYWSAGGSEQLRISGGGSVTVAGNFYTNGSSTFTPSSGETVVITRDSAGPYFGNSSNHSLRIITNNASRINISNSGNISTHPPAGNHFVINEDGVDSDFRVESDANSHMLFVDGGNNCVSAGGGISPAGSNWGFFAEGQTKDTSSNTYTAAKFASDAYVDTGEYTTMLGMGVEKSAYWSKGGIGYTRTAGYDVGYLGFYLNGTISNANLTLADEVLRLTPSEVVVNDRSRSTVDFRVESDANSHMLFVDGGNNKIGINESHPAASLDIRQSTNSNTDGLLVRPVNESQSMIYSFLGMRNTYFTHFVTDSANSGNANYEYFKFFAGTEDINGELLQLHDDYTVFNGGGLDRDFRVESSGNANMLFVDASANTVFIGGTTTGTNVIHLDAGRIILDKSSDWNIESGGSANGSHIRFRQSNADVGFITSTSTGTTYNTTSDVA